MFECTTHTACKLHGRLSHTTAERPKPRNSVFTLRTRELSRVGLWSTTFGRICMNRRNDGVILGHIDHLACTLSPLNDTRFIKLSECIVYITFPKRQRSREVLFEEIVHIPVTIMLGDLHRGKAIWNSLSSKLKHRPMRRQVFSRG